MAGAKAAHIDQRELLAWFDEQQRKPFSVVSPANPTVKQFDPLYTRRRKDGEQGRPGKKQRTLTLTLTLTSPQGRQNRLCPNGKQT